MFHPLIFYPDPAYSFDILKFIRFFIKKNWELEFKLQFIFPSLMINSIAKVNNSFIVLGCTVLSCPYHNLWTTLWFWNWNRILSLFDTGHKGLAHLISYRLKLLQKLIQELIEFHFLHIILCRTQNKHWYLYSSSLLNWRHFAVVADLQRTGSRLCSGRIWNRIHDIWPSDNRLHQPK